MRAADRWGTGWIVVVVLSGTLAAQTERVPPTPQSEDVVVGAWQLDLSKSHYQPGPGPKEETRTYEPGHEGIHATILTTDQQGQTHSIDYVASYNDVVAVVTGSSQVDAIKLRKIDDRTAEATLSFMGKVVGTARRVIAPDGKTMTITFKRDAPDAVDNVAVYRRMVTPGS
jgi:hypothetical protein